MTAAQCSDRSMSEKTLQKRVVERAKRRGWKVAHAGKGWVGGDGSHAQFVTPMAPGWPDLTLAKAGHKLIFIELKTEKGEPSEDQWFWLELLNQTGSIAIIIRPSDLSSGLVNAILEDGYPL